MLGYTQGVSNFVNPTKIEIRESPLLTIALSTQTEWEHGFDSSPDETITELECITAEQNYEIGDKLLITNLTSSAANAGYSLYENANGLAVGVILHAALYELNKTTGALTAITAANWKIRFICKKITVGDNPDITRVGLIPIETGSINSEIEYESPILNNEYWKYELFFSNLQPATDTVNLLFQFSTDGGINYKSGTSDYMYGGAAINQTPSEAYNSDETASYIQPHQAGNFGTAAGEDATGKIDIYPAFQGGKAALRSEFIHRNNGNNIRVQYGGGRYETDESINRFRMYFSSGNIATLKYQLNGYRIAV